MTPLTTAKPPPPIYTGEGSSEIAEVHRQLLADSSIQFELPLFTPPAPRPPSAWQVWLADFFSSEHPILQALLYLLLGFVIALILWLVIRAVLRSDWWQRRKDEGAEDEAWRPDQAPARALLAEADALAARGLFAEAVHLLLHRSLEDLDQRRPGVLRPALTSRDIAALPVIPDDPRSAFARIVERVERSLFARRPLVQEDWAQCREAYERFAFAGAWR